MKNLMKIFKAVGVFFVFMMPSILKADNCPLKNTNAYLVSCQGKLSQTWDQKNGQGPQTRDRQYFISVPDENQKKLPFLFIFHGNGGNGEDFLNNFKNKFSILAEKFIIVAPSGFERSWNIVAEESRAPDYEFFKDLVNFVTGFKNVEGKDINLYGVSNGAGFVNNLLIQLDDLRIVKAITEVSQLNIKQYHHHKFWKQGKLNQYEEAKVPLQGRKILVLSGEQDFIVPFVGGQSAIPANYSRTEKLQFLSAESSVLAWAKAMGYKGSKARERSYNDSISFWSYLNGQVSHYSFAWDGHSIKNEEKIKIIRNFFLGVKEIPLLVVPSF